MIPINSDFALLYFVYTVVLIFITTGLFFRKDKKEYLIHLVIYLLYTIFMMYVFTDEENFSGGGSLVVLFYGLLFPILHIVGYGITRLIQFIIKKK